MAKVEKIVTPAPVPPSVITYVLTLSQDEAYTLRTICGSISGYSEHTRRKHTEAIGNALDAVGVHSQYDKGGIKGLINFTT